MDLVNFLESLFRWIHVVAGILWIGLLYFFNWVNTAFAPTMDADTKKKVVPELLPRALYWFRWGAAFTWVTGVLLLTPAIKLAKPEGMTISHVRMPCDIKSLACRCQTL